ncbi:MAG: hypothetical protein KR126chlam1_00394 [Chlamydiae bacterium]|nr:hypothetical protein [Chlamydiota bacterium]
MGILNCSQLRGFQERVSNNWQTPPRAQDFSAELGTQNASCIAHSVRREGSDENILIHRYPDGELFLARRVKEIAIRSALVGGMGAVVGGITFIGHVIFTAKEGLWMFAKKTREERDAHWIAAGTEFTYAKKSFFSIGSSLKEMFHAYSDPIAARKELFDLDRRLYPQAKGNEKSVLTQDEAKRTLAEVGILSTGSLFAYFLLPSIAGYSPWITTIMGAAALSIPLFGSYRRYQAFEKSFPKFAVTEVVGMGGHLLKGANDYIESWQRRSSFSVTTFCGATSLGNYSDISGEASRREFSPSPAKVLKE